MAPTPQDIDPVTSRRMRAVRPATLLLGLFLMFVPGARAGGYDKTTWGMTLSQVQKLYPGGLKETTQTGDVYYTLVRKVAGLDAVVGFVFENTRLTFVSVQFPMPGTPVVTKGRTGYMRPTSEAARSTETIVRDGLMAKYGAPVFDSEKQRDTTLQPGNEGGVDYARRGDDAHLTIKPLEDGLRTEIGVNYGKWDPHDQQRSARGL